MCSLQLHHVVHSHSSNKIRSQSQGPLPRHGIRVVASYSIRHHSMGIERIGWSVPISKSKRKSLSRGGFCYARALAIPVPSNEVANAVKLFAKSTIARVLEIIHGSQLLQQCAPAAGLMAFAMWGLGPLLRFIHRTILHKEDRSWKESQLNYIMRMYVRPVLLWIGVILVCRAFDPVVLSTESSQAIKQRFINFVRSLSTVLAFAYCTNSVIQQLHKVMLDRQDTPDSRSLGAQFVGNAVYTAVWIAAVCLFMELLGFSTQKMLTAGGLGTVLLTLAGREIFTNFLSSIMIHATRPFVLNEWIQTKIDGYEVSGTVEHVGWWSPTIVRGDDREAVHIPNHKFTVSIVRNLSQKSHWRIKTYFGISHLDVSKISNIVADMRKVLAKHPQVEQRRLHRRVFFESISPENQALMVLVSCFVKTPHFEEYLRVKEVILLDLMKVISHHHARLATPIRSVQRVLDDIEPRAAPFRDMNRAAEAQGRPYLLIEATAYRDSEQSPSSKNGASQARDDTNSDGEDSAGLTISPKKDGLKAKDDTSNNDGTAGSTINSKKSLQSKDDGSSNDGATKSTLSSDSASGSIIIPRKGLQAKDDTSNNDGTAKSVHPSEVAESKAASKHKSQLEGLDSMGLNSKDITLLGAAFEKPPAKIPEDPAESQLHGEKASTNPVSDIGSARSERNSGKASEHILQLTGSKVQQSHSRVSESPGLSVENNSERHGKATMDMESLPSREDKRTSEELADTDLLHTTQKSDTRRPQMHNISPSKGETERGITGGHTLGGTKSQIGENIVLGVALNGPKQTLPLDDDISPAPEQKELVASSNGNTSNGVKDVRSGAQPPNAGSSESI